MDRLPFLEGTARLFLDSAPILYHLEGHTGYRPLLSELFGRIRDGRLTAVTSPVSLTECLQRQPRLGTSCSRLIAHDLKALLVPFDRSIVRRAGQLCARYGLTHADSLQVAAAMDTGCDGLLTNDRSLQRVAEIRVLVLDDWRAHG